VNYLTEIIEHLELFDIYILISVVLKSRSCGLWSWSQAGTQNGSKKAD